MELEVKAGIEVRRCIWCGVEFSFHHRCAYGLEHLLVFLNIPKLGECLACGRKYRKLRGHWNRCPKRVEYIKKLVHG